MRIWRYLALLAVFILFTNDYRTRAHIWTIYADKIGGRLYGCGSLRTYADKVSSQLNAAFSQQGISYPPKHVAVLAFKDTNMLQLYAKNSDMQNWQLVKT